MIQHVSKAAFKMLAAFAQEDFAGRAFDRTVGLVDDLFDDGFLFVLTALGGVGIANDSADALALQAAYFLDGEVTFMLK